MLRLRLPSLHDEGLVFDSLQGEFTMEDGLLRIERLELDSVAYAVNAEGTLDYRRDVSAVPIELNVLKGLTSPISAVPIAGDALALVNIRLHGSGSPWDMKVRFASLTDQLVRGTLAAPRSLIKRVRDAVKLVTGERGECARSRQQSRVRLWSPHPRRSLESLQRSTWARTMRLSSSTQPLLAAKASIPSQPLCHSRPP